MFDTICDLTPRDPDYSERTRTLDILTRVLEGQLYDALPFQFHEERTIDGVYIPLRNRRPSVRYPLCRVVVEDSVALLFSEGHFPTIDCPDPLVRQTMAAVVKESRLNMTMIDAAIRGSIGSVAILLKVIRGRVFFQTLNTLYLTAQWSPDEPDVLAEVIERYKVKGRLLKEAGYKIDDAAQEYWFSRRWTRDSEIWYEPEPVGGRNSEKIDDARSVHHGLGFVPLVWIKNLPGHSSTGHPDDGACTFRPAIESQIEIDYQLSQVGRGLKYSSDPTLLLKDPSPASAEIVKGAGNALVVGEHGDARLLEIGGSASAAVIEYVRTLRELALESVHGNRASPERLTAAQSGRALELLNQGLLWLADNLRVTYGEIALISLTRLIIRASHRYELRVLGQSVRNLDEAAPITLKWPRWYPLSADDRQKDAQTLAILVNAGHISRETAMKAISDTYDLEDIAGETARINAEQAENGVKSTNE